MGKGLDRDYGVLIGMLVRHELEAEAEEGRWPHYQVYTHYEEFTSDLISPKRVHLMREHRSGINLKSRAHQKIQYIYIEEANPDLFSNILTLKPGFHFLGATSSSGALDGQRHPIVQNQDWKLVNAGELADRMPKLLRDVTRLYIFGEPFGHSPRDEENKMPKIINFSGIHNIHLTQEDPVDSSFAVENAIWQDGGLLMRYDNLDPFGAPRLAFLMTKFSTQTLPTDDQGRPLA